MATNSPTGGPENEIAKEALTRRPVRVTVTIVDDEEGGAYDMDSNEVPLEKGGNRGPKLTFNNNQGNKYHDGFQVIFDLVDETDHGYVFFQDPDNPAPSDAMSVKLIDDDGYCPRRGETWDGFKPVEVTRGQTRLIVDNPNRDRQHFGFAFHFSTARKPRPTLTYDPVGENQNGELR